MTIRKRFSLSFLGIIALFAVNVVVYSWSNQRRAEAVQDLQRAISRQVLISSIERTLNDTQKQVSLLSQVATEAGASGASPAEKEQFSAQLGGARKAVAGLVALSDTGGSDTRSGFQKSFDELVASWQVFYDNFGVNQAKAIAELAVRADPLSRKLIEELMPAMQAEEDRAVQAASENFHAAARIGDRVSFAILLISTLVAIVLAYLVSRNLTNGLSALKTGATKLGSGELGYRIDLNRSDELGHLAAAFNEMAERLAAARQDLTKAHEDEKRKSEELASALDQLNKAQDQLVVQQKLASLGTLTAGIAHEIKNPLNFVTNFSAISVGMIAEVREVLTENRDRLGPKDYQYLTDLLNDLTTNITKIQEHGKRADGIVKGMLMHSRGQKGQLQPTNINSLVSEYVKLAYHGMRAQDINFNVTIDENYDASNPTLLVVPHDLSRVVLNLANNACYAANDKAKRAGADFRPTIRVSTRVNGNGVEIGVRDNGDGIPQEIRQRVFEPFFTTKPAGSGTGLGLSMSYDIVVQEHKGQLRVESEPGQFAEFIITLPKGSDGIQNTRS